MERSADKSKKNLNYNGINRFKKCNTERKCEC